jgi:dermatan 4-sulfotransferase 1
VPGQITAAWIAQATVSGRLNMEATWVSERCRYFYMAIPKVASSKIKMVLQQVEGYPLPADPFDVHARDRPGSSFVSRLADFSPGQAVEILTGPDWFRFAFVRNPYDRLLSAYHDKIADLASPYVGVRASILALGGHPPDSKRIPTFADFVRYVEAQPDLQRDGHWRSQAGILCLDDISYDFIGRQERFEADFAYALRQFSKLESTSVALSEVINASRPGAAAGAYDATLAALVYGTYKTDFDAFGYSATAFTTSTATS